MSQEGDLTSKALGYAFAGGGVMTALLDELVNKGVLTSDEVRGILQRAQNGTANFYETEIGREAGRVISDILASFSEGRT
jgi:hypothetical protein